MLSIEFLNVITSRLDNKAYYHNNIAFNYSAYTLDIFAYKGSKDYLLFNWDTIMIIS